MRAENEPKQPDEVGLAPVKPKTAYGEQLQWYLKMEPQLFKAAIEDQLEKLSAEKQALVEKEEQAKSEKPAEAQADQAQLALYKRMGEVRANEIRATVEDLMYVLVLEKFQLIGVEMLPRMDGFVDAPISNLQVLTEGIHSKEALELLKEHLMSVMGPAEVVNQFKNAVIKMSKLQMAQVYATSIMFGYFLRRVDKRFQLEKVLGTLPVSPEDTVARLERLFAQANSDGANPDVVDVDVGADNPPQGPSADPNVPRSKGSQKSALRKYVESFDQATMVETARVVSVEAAALVERQASALFGDIKKLTQQMQDVIGKDASSYDEVFSKMAEAVSSETVEVLTMTVATQRRAVLEAVAYGSFLRDTETYVQTDYSLVTPLPLPKLPPSGGPMGGSIM